MSTREAAGELHAESPAYVVLALVVALVAAVFGGMSLSRVAPASAPPQPTPAVVQTTGAGVDTVLAGAAASGQDPR